MRKIRESLLFVFKKCSGLRAKQGETLGCESSSLIYRLYFGYGRGCVTKEELKEEPKDSVF